MKVITIQPEPVVDNMWVDNNPNAKSPIIFGERLPYPFHIDAATGDVLDQEFWKGDPLRVVGFQKDEEIQTVNLWWADAAADPDKIVGMFPVMVGPEGLYTYTVKIESVDIIEKD